MKAFVRNRLWSCPRFGSMVLAALALATATVQMRAQSALDGFDPNANGAVHVVVVQPDGKILIGGDFTSLSPNGGAAVTRNFIARLNPDGTLDTAFNPNANAAIDAIAVQADGKILVGGGFHGPNSIGGQTRNYIARLDPTTGLADSFDPNANNHCHFNRGADRRQDFEWVDILTEQTASADSCATILPGSTPRRAWLIHSTRMRTTLSLQSRCRQTARFWWAGISTDQTHRRTDAQPYRPARCHHRPGRFV